MVMLKKFNKFTSTLICELFFINSNGSTNKKTLVWVASYLLHYGGNIWKKLNIDKSNTMGIFYRASFFGAGIKEMCRLWLNNDCKETPEHMASLLLEEYTNRQ